MQSAQYRQSAGALQRSTFVKVAACSESICEMSQSGQRRQLVNADRVYELPPHVSFA